MPQSTCGSKLARSLAVHSRMKRLILHWHKIPRLILDNVRHCLSDRAVSLNEPMVHGCVRGKSFALSVPFPRGAPRMTAKLEGTLPDSLSNLGDEECVADSQRRIEDAPTPLAALEVPGSLFCRSPDRDEAFERAGALNVFTGRIDTVDWIGLDVRVEVRIAAVEQEWILVGPATGLWIVVS